MLKSHAPLFLLLFLFACNQPEAVHWRSHTLPADFPTEWHVVTNDPNEGLIIFHPCDAENRTHRLHGDSLIVNGGHETDRYLIRTTDQDTKGEIRFTTNLPGTADTQYFYFLWDDAEKQLGSWRTRYPRVSYDMEYRMVSGAKRDQYPTINQPCVECWGEECDLIAAKAFKPEAEFSIHGIKNGNAKQLKMEDSTMCAGWMLDEVALRTILHSAEELSVNEHHHLYDHLPCVIQATVKQGDLEYELELNGGAWFTMSAGDSSWLYTVGDRSHLEYFISGPWESEEDEALREHLERWKQQQIADEQFVRGEDCNYAYAEEKDFLVLGFPEEMNKHYADFNRDGKTDILVTFAPIQCDGGNMAANLQYQLLLLSEEDTYTFSDDFFEDILPPSDSGLLILTGTHNDQVLARYLKFKADDSDCCPSISLPVVVDVVSREIIPLENEQP